MTTDPLPALPIFAWAHNARMEFVHHAVKDLWLKVSAQQVENYTEALVLLDDALTAITAERARADALQARNSELGEILESEERRADALQAALQTVRMRLEVAHRLLDIASGPSGARAAFRKIDEAISDIDAAARSLIDPTKGST